MQNPQRDLSLAALYFLLSTIITAWFIAEKRSIYHDLTQMMLSGSIAGAKWGIQIVAAVFLLPRNRFEFIRRISFVCLIGSVLLFSIYPLSLFEISDQRQFVNALLISVGVMILLYFLAVRKCKISITWFFGWLLCLLIAISLQLTIVFHII